MLPRKGISVILHSDIGDSAGNTIERTLFPPAECTGCRQQGHVNSKTWLQQNIPVLDWGVG